MHTKINGIAVDLITLRWDSKCAKCGAMMPKGTSACWLPDSKWTHGGTVRSTEVQDAAGAQVTKVVKYTSTGHWKGTVTHRPDHACASEYVVKAVYDSTAKSITVSAFAADVALQLAMMRLTRSKHTAAPSAYIVYQGNVPVLTHAVPMQRTHA